MQVRMDTFTLTEDDRRAIRFQNDKRKTQCSRNEAKEWINNVVQAALNDLRYRWSGGAGVPAAVANGADPNKYAEATQAPAPAAAAAEEPAGAQA